MTRSKPLRIFILLALLVGAGAFLPVPSTISTKEKVPVSTQPLRVLFIGNSFTSGGSLPRLVEELSLHMQQPIDTEMVAPGGVYMSWHVENKATLDAIKGSPWDIVVLQDCSTCPLQYEKHFRQGIKDMARIVREAKATPMLFMTWADLHKQSDIGKIARGYTEIGTELDIAVVPVGVAWKLAAERPNGAVLFESDRHHASLAGALLSSYVFLTMLEKSGDVPTDVRLRKAPELMYELLFPQYQRYADETLAQSLKAIAAKSLDKKALNEILEANAQTPQPILTSQG